MLKEDGGRRIPRKKQRHMIPQHPLLELVFSWNPSSPVLFNNPTKSGFILAIPVLKSTLCTNVHTRLIYDHLVYNGIGPGTKLILKRIVSKCVFFFQPTNNGPVTIHIAYHAIRMQTSVSHNDQSIQRLQNKKSLYAL